MTAPLTPRSCSSCGTAVLPDQYGYWVDQQNGRHCGNHPSYPHYVADAPQQQSRTKAALVTGGILVSVAIITGAAVLISGMGGDGSGNPTDAQGSTAPSTGQPSATSKSKESSPPLAPIPCDPDLPHGMYCFPSTISGQDMLDRINDNLGWDCYKKGEKDASGDAVNEVGKCAGRNTAKNPYSMSFEVSYDTNTHDVDGKTTKVSMVAGTAADLGDGERTNRKNTIEVGNQVAETAIAYLWPENEKLQRSAYNAVKEAQRACSQGKRSGEIDILYGYTASCSAPSSIEVTQEDGDTIVSITQSLYIDISDDPSDRN